MSTTAEGDVPYPWHLGEVPAAWWISTDLCQHVSSSKLRAEPQKPSEGLTSQMKSSMCECVWGIITSPNNLKQSRVSMGKSYF